MEKRSKILGIVLLVLAFLCVGMYFVYNAKFSSFVVKFDSEGGTTIPEQTVDNGGKAIKPADPTRENGDFIEWQLNGQTYNFDNAVTSNITLKALWQLYNSYSVVVTLDGNQYSQKVRENEVVNIANFNVPNKEGYKVKLYNEDNTEYDLTSQVTSDLNLIAKYVALQKYTVKFNSNGGSKVSDVTVTEGNQVQEPSVTRDGYILDGWYLDNDKYDFATPITKNITLKAKWNEGTRYTVTFNADGKVYKTSSALENTKVSKPTDPTKAGYKFVEWQLDDKAFSFDTKITGDITLTAKFEKITAYTVTFNSDGGSEVKSQQVEVGKKATKPTDPTKAGYSFGEWQLNGKAYNFDSTVNSDITLKAAWKKVYTVTFNKENGTSDDTQSVVEGNTVTKPTDPVKEGYVFDEWLYNRQTFDFTTPITQDITLVAHYRPSTSNPDVLVEEK